MRAGAHHVVLVLGVLRVDLRLVGGRPVDRRSAHAVELADLRVALQHLQAVGVVRDLERRRRHHAAAAEGARLVARDARLELGRARRAGDVVHVLLLRRRRDVQQELRSGAGFGEYIGVAAARRPESRLATRLGGYDQHVGRHLVPRHARLGRLDALVQAKALLLHNRVLADVVRHRRAHVALRAEALLDVVCESRQERG